MESPGVPAPMLSPTSSRTIGPLRVGARSRRTASATDDAARVERLALLPGALGHRLGRSLGDRHVAVGDRDERHAHVRHVGVREALADRQVDAGRASRRSARARPRRRPRIGSSPVFWARMFASIGGLTTACTGWSSPRTVWAMSSASCRPRSRQSRCGFVRHRSVMSAPWTWAGETLPWVSMTLPIGTRGPTTSRTRRIISASPSG